MKVLDAQLGEMTDQMNDLVSQIEKLVQDNAKHAQNQKEYSAKFEALNAAIEEKKATIEDVKQQISDALSRRENVRIFLEGLRQLNPITEFDIPSWHALVEHVKVMPDKTLIFRLRNEEEISIPLAEVQ